MSMNYIIFDLEATCEENVKLPNSEIIEIGAVRLDENFEETGQFAEFVKPVLNPILSEFCKKLTTIQQENVDGANVFSQVMTRFENWILEQEPYTIYSWGAYDKKQILKESEMKNYSGKIQNILNHHVNLKEEYRIFQNQKEGRGMNKALIELGIPLTGTHHRGIDDAINIAKIFRKIKGKL